MMWWDREVRRRLESFGPNVRLYLRYVDDINIVIEVPRKGARYKSGRLVYSQEDIDSDEDIEDDKRAMLLFQKVGNSIHKSIQVEIEVPSHHADKKMPILDLKVWIERRDEIYLVLHEFYMKEVSTKSLVQAQSALAWSVKRTVLTQDALRIMMNCSRLLPLQRITEHLSHFSLRMQYSGYTHKFRSEIIDSAYKAYEKIKELADSETRPFTDQENGKEKREARLKDRNSSTGIRQEVMIQ